MFRDNRECLVGRRSYVRVTEPLDRRVILSYATMHQCSIALRCIDTSNGNSRIDGAGVRRGGGMGWTEAGGRQEANACQRATSIRLAASTSVEPQGLWSSGTAGSKECCGGSLQRAGRSRSGLTPALRDWDALWIRGREWSRRAVEIESSRRAASMGGGGGAPNLTACCPMAHFQCERPPSWAEPSTGL